VPGIRHQQHTYYDERKRKGSKGEENDLSSRAQKKSILEREVRASNWEDKAVDSTVGVPKGKTDTFG